MAATVPKQYDALNACVDALRAAQSVEGYIHVVAHTDAADDHHAPIARDLYAALATRMDNNTNAGGAHTLYTLHTYGHSMPRAYVVHIIAPWRTGDATLRRNAGFYMVTT